MSGRTEHDGIARGATSVSVAGFVVGTVVGLQFGQAEPGDFPVVAATEVFAQEVARDFKSRAIEKLRCEGPPFDLGIRFYG